MNETQKELRLMMGLTLIYGKIESIVAKLNKGYEGPDSKFKKEHLAPIVKVAALCRWLAKDKDMEPIPDPKGGEIDYDEISDNLAFLALAVLEACDFPKDWEWEG